MKATKETPENQTFFIIDKLGYYRMTSGDVAYIDEFKRKPQRTCTGLTGDTKGQLRVRRTWNRYGRWSDGTLAPYDLVEYLSPELYPELYI